MSATTNPFGDNDLNPTELYYGCKWCDESFATADARKKHKRRNHPNAVPCRYHVLDDYGMWTHRYEGESTMVSVHQLLAIFDGADPYEVFADDTHVHHGPDIEHPRANIPGNVQVMDHAEHIRHHRRINDYELLGEIYRLNRELDGPVLIEDMNEHGEYSINTYYRHFGSWSHAKELAGITDQNM